MRSKDIEILLNTL